MEAGRVVVGALRETRLPLPRTGPDSVPAGERGAGRRGQNTRGPGGGGPLT